MTERDILQELITWLNTRARHHRQSAREAHEQIDWAFSEGASYATQYVIDYLEVLMRYTEPEHPRAKCEICGAPATGGCIGPDGQHLYCEEHRAVFVQDEEHYDWE